MALELRRKKNNKKILPPNTGLANNMIRRTALILVSSVSPGCQVCGLTAAKKGEGLPLRTTKENYSVFMLLQLLSNWTNLKTKTLVVWF